MSNLKKEKRKTTHQDHTADKISRHLQKPQSKINQNKLTPEIQQATNSNNKKFTNTYPQTLERL